MAIELVRNFQGREPWVNFKERPDTDANGRFTFKRVPPGDVRIARVVPMRENSWTHVPQTNIVATPGTKHDLGSMKTTQAPRIY